MLAEEQNSTVFYVPTAVSINWLRYNIVTKLVYNCLETDFAAIWFKGYYFMGKDYTGPGLCIELSNCSTTLEYSNY